MVVLALFALPLDPLTAVGEELRIETKVSLQGDEVSQNLTVFTQGRVYDFRFDTSQGKTLQEVVIFRPLEGDFEILDAQRRVRLSLNKQSIAKFVAGMKTNPVLLEKARHFIEPQFNESWDAESGWLTLTSDRIIYRVTGPQTAASEALTSYQDFANWYVKLNAADPRKMPPFPRLALNDALQRRDMIPERVELVIKPGGGIVSRPFQVSSTHSMVWSINKSDQELIERARELFAECESVDRTTYYQLGNAN